MTVIKSFDNRLVISVFSYVDDLLRAYTLLKERGFELRVYSPCPIPDIEEHVANFWSPVRVFTAAGAALGLIGGFALAILTSLDWPLRTSAKAVVSVPAFVVVGYELTILLGGLATLLGLFFLTRVPQIFNRDIGYKPEFSSNKFGLVFKCSKDELKDVYEILRTSNAEDIEVRDRI